MRNREEILRKIKPTSFETIDDLGLPATAERVPELRIEEATLEVLLDIRDLLCK